MGLFFRSIQVSITGFWRFLVVLPFLIVLIFLMIGVTLIVFWPAAIVGLFASVTFAQLVAVRTALAAEGEHGSPVLSSLVGASVKYAMFQLLVFAVFILFLGAIYILANRLGIDDLRRFRDIGGMPWQDAVRYNPISMSLTGLYVVFSLWFYASMMVPMAAAAWSASEKVQPYDFFWGFGASLLPMAVIIGLSGFVQYALNTGEWSGKLLILVMETIWSHLAQIRPPKFTPEDLIQMILAFGLNVLLLYWQSVASALAFLKRRDAVEAARQQSQLTAKDRWIDPRELRQIRNEQQKTWD